MKRHTKFAILLVVVVVAIAAIGAATATATSDDDGTDTAITGVEYERASEAAIAHLGGGTVTDSEVDDEESYYEVEVTLNDGTQVDVQLDAQFQVVGTEEDGPNDED